MLNACDCFYEVEQQGTSIQTKNIFIITKLVRRDSCDSVVPGKIKKKVTIMTSESRVSRETVEDVEISQVLVESTDSDGTIFSSGEDEDGMNWTVTKMDSWKTILKQMRMEAFVVAIRKLFI
jgi:hypothetical protein